MTSRPLRQPADQLIPELAGYQRQLLIAGGVGGAVSLIGLFSNPAQFFQSYLMAYMFVLGATLGCLALGMIHQLSGGAWGVVTRRLIGAASRVLPVLTLLFLPIAFGIGHLYEWSHADIVAADVILRGKQVYLNTPFFLARAAVYFLAWNALTYFLNKWSLEQDRNPDPRIARRMQRLSGGGLLVYGLTVTFASFDWLMSLDPHWYSTIYGVLLMGGQGLTALAFLIVALAWLSRRQPLDAIVVPGHFHDLANLMLAFVMLWAYFSVLPVLDHLVGQSSRGNHLVRQPAARRLAVRRSRTHRVPLRRAVPAPAVPHPSSAPRRPSGRSPPAFSSRSSSICSG